MTEAEKQLAKLVEELDYAKFQYGHSLAQSARCLAWGEKRKKDADELEKQIDRIKEKITRS
jgi:hypothetical protein